MERRPLTKAQKFVLSAAFVPMLATGVAGGIGTYTNISGAYGTGTALGAVAAGEGATAVLALVLLGLTMLGQSSPAVVRLGLWATPLAAAVMAAMAADDPGSTVIYAVTPMGMCVAAEGMAFLARRIVVHTDGRDAEAEARATAIIRSLAYHRARAANHPDAKVQGRSDRKAWRLARKAGTGDTALGARLLDVQRERVTAGADVALAEMFSVPVTVTAPVTTPVTAPVTTPVTTPAIDRPQRPALEAPSQGRDAEDTQVTPAVADDGGEGVTPVTAEPVTVPEQPQTGDLDDAPESEPRTGVTLSEVAAVAGVTAPVSGEPLSGEQLVVVLRYLRHSVDPPMSYRQAAAAFREAGYVGAEKRVRTAWGTLLSHEETA